eukprot:GHVL01016932.1.p2 GENE.GHVL01016932.1~~GHVL01016932.1.p2  ORF type:complete len:410 (+),score=82.66 GHVL01016932.1:2926-4155(+)
MTEDDCKDIHNDGETTVNVKNNTETEKVNVNKSSPDSKTKSSVTDKTTEHIRRSPRERRQTQTFRTEDTHPHVKTQMNIPKGDGMQLGGIAYIKTMLDHVSADDEALKGLHKCLYHVVGHKVNRKRHLREWSGLPGSNHDDSLKKFRTFLSSSKTISTLKQMCKICGLEQTGKKGDQVERLACFLVRPKDMKKTAQDSSDKKKGIPKSAGFRRSPRNTLKTYDDENGDCHDNTAIAAGNSETDRHSYNKNEVICDKDCSSAQNKEKNKKYSKIETRTDSTNDKEETDNLQKQAVQISKSSDNAEILTEQLVNRHEKGEYTEEADRQSDKSAGAQPENIVTVHESITPQRIEVTVDVGDDRRHPSQAAHRCDLSHYSQIASAEEKKHLNEGQAKELETGDESKSAAMATN